MKKWIEIASLVFALLCTVTIVACLLIAFFRGDWAQATFWLVAFYVHGEQRTPKGTAEEDEDAE